MATSSASAPTPAPGELVFTHSLNAPRALVFRILTDPKHVAEWSWSKGFTDLACEVAPEPGGAFQIHMRGPDGGIYPITGVFCEIVKPERLVVACAGLDKNANALFELLNTVTLDELGGNTKLTLHARVTRATAVAAPYLVGMEQGGNRSIERLAAYIAIKSKEQSI